MLDIIYKRAYKGYKQYEATSEYGDSWEDHFEMDHSGYEAEIDYQLYRALEDING